MQTNASSVSSAEVAVALAPLVDQVAPEGVEVVTIRLTRTQYNTLQFLFGAAMGDLEAREEQWQDARRERLDEGGAL